MKRKMILDCDTGHDDAIALMVASKHPDIELMGVTVVAGNQTLPKTLNNTLHVADHLGLDVPVYGGMSLPLVREQYVADDVHGESGLDGPVFGELHKKAEEKHAVSYLIDTLMAGDGDITLVPVGPLTNIAAHIVFTSGVHITMMPLDLTNTALADMRIIERMEGIGNMAGKLFGDIMRFTFRSQAVNGLDAGPVHDVTAVTYLVAPELYHTQDMYVEIDTNRYGPGYGRTVCDANDRYHKIPNATVGLSIDLDRFWDLVEDTLRRHI